MGMRNARRLAGPARGHEHLAAHPSIGSEYKMMKQKMSGRLALAAIGAIVIPALVVTAPAASSRPVAPTLEAAVAGPACPGVAATVIFSRPGVTWCHNSRFQVAVIDTSAGAKMAVVSQHEAGTGNGTGARFYNKDAGEWSRYITDGRGPTSPAPSKLALVVNAGFLVDDTGSDNSTRLPLPELRGSALQTPGFALEGSDPAWKVPKRLIRMGNPGQTPQNITFGDFGTQSGPSTGTTTISTSTARSPATTTQP